MADTPYSSNREEKQGLLGQRSDDSVGSYAGDHALGDPENPINSGDMEHVGSSMGRTGSDGILRDALDDFGRTLSGSIAKASGDLRETYMCYVCQGMQEVDSEAMQLHCGHTIHRQCWRAKLTFHIENNQGRSPCCDRPKVKNAPFDPKTRTYDGGMCGQELQDQEIAAIVPPEVFARLQRLRTMNADPHMRSCEQCGTAQPGFPGKNKIVCNNTACGHVFCYAHGDSCQARGEGDTFEKRCESFAARDDEDIQWIAKEESEGKLRHCPECTAPVYKNGGCNAMMCTNCKTGFCWLCGERIVDAEGFPPHFSSWNKTSPCAGKQFEGYDGDGAGPPMTPCEGIWTCIVMLLTFLIFLPFIFIWLLVLGLLVFGILPFTPCGMGAGWEDCRRKTTSALAVITATIFFLAPLLITLLLWGPWLLYMRCKNQNWVRQQRAEADAAATRGLERYEAAGLGDGSTMA